MRFIQFKNEGLEKLIKKTIDILMNGGLVISPSDTVYALLVDATNQEAVNKLIQFKNRPLGKPISIFVSNMSMLKKQVVINEEQLRLIQELLPGPFTVIFPSKHLVVALLESEKGTLGVRIPDDKFISKLVKKYGKPVTATSANLSGRPPHYSVKSLLNTLPEKKKKLIDLIVDNGQLPRNKPSTVVDLTKPNIKLLRRGDIVFKDEKSYLSNSPRQTRKIATFILQKILRSKIKLPLIFILEGELGVGKTVFVIYYEYSVATHPEGVFFPNKLIHIDLYNIKDPEEFRYLGLEKYLTKECLLCFEWGEKVGEIIDTLKSKGKIIYVRMRYISENEREIHVNF